MELNFEKVKVLLVDDDENFTFALKALLKSKGLEIESLSNPEEALEFLKNNKFDMILLDYYMPQMTGEQFLTQLRTFDKGTIVFLQTAFSEEKPQFDMLQSLNIQGYIDKNKDPNDIFLDIVSGVKMAELIRVIKEKDKEIAKLSYKKAITGNLITNLVNEAKDQVMQISLMNESISQETEEYKKQNEVINNAVAETYKLYEALNFEYIKQSYIKELKNIIEKLLKPTAILNSINISFDIQNENEVVDESFVEAIYFIIKTVQILAENEMKEINIKYIGEKCFEINYDKNIDSSKLKELEILDINMNIENNNIKFNI